MIDQDFVAKLSNIAKNNRLPLTEEATKMAMVVPFFMALGYNVFDPEEFVPEYDADAPGIKKGEKVDYAIMQDGAPAVIIEAKCAGMDLTPHRSQLFRYFVATSARIGILTNGLEYWFFTDIEKMNVMDDAPFLKIRLDSLVDSDIEALELFRKPVFSPKPVRDEAHRLKYQGVFLDMLERQFEKPSDDLLALFVGMVCDKAVTKEQVSRFRPALESAMRMFLSGRNAQSHGSPECDVQIAEDVPIDVPEESDKKISKFVLSVDGLPAEHMFRSNIATTLAICDVVRDVYGSDRFRDTVCSHVFFEKAKVRKVFSMDEADMRGFSYHTFDDGLYMLTNYNCVYLKEIQRHLLELFPRISVEFKYTDVGAGDGQFLVYWTAFIEYAYQNAEFCRCFPDRAIVHDRRYMVNRKVIPGIELNPVQIRSEGKLRCELYIRDNKPLFAKLYGVREHIEHDIGGSLSWEPLDGKKASRIKSEIDADFDNEPAWPEQFEWLVDTMIRFRDVFVKYV